MSAGAVIGIIVGVVVLLGVGGFFAYRSMAAKRETDEKQFMQDYPVSKIGSEPNESVANTQSTPNEYDFTTLDGHTSKATSEPLESSIAMLHDMPSSSPSPSAQEPTKYNFDPAQSTQQ
ncbi:DNA/RNA polymerase [Phytophthora cinnamomi]|uniref:DNA/RNA polymerase n=1 Tax=Phytophthora cinnamomi TaxID=4785 RepID=UPI003559C717|nr:DNA/RNA polymerase [Phytophthora cinnamomi]